MSTPFRGHALVVSVDQNSDHRLEDLGPSVRADGDLVEGILRDEDVCGYSPTRVQRLTGTNATASAVLDAFNRLNTLDPNDPVFFFFSGHGDATSCDGSDGASLFPCDADLGHCTNVLSSRVLKDAWGSLPSKRKLAVVDACFSGGLAITKSSSPTSKELPHRELRALAEGEGSVLISSSRSTEPSLILGHDNVSLFTKHLANGLLGLGGHDGDGFVRVFDLFNYVAMSVRRDAPEQSPVYTAFHQDLNFAVAFCTNAARRNKRPDVIEINARQNQIRTVSSLFETLYPLGPTDQALWERAGGNLAQLTLTGQGRTDWFRAIRLATQGGGSLTVQALCEEALSDYPRNPDLQRLISVFSTSR